MVSYMYIYWAGLGYSEVLYHKEMTTPTWGRQSGRLSKMTSSTPMGTLTCSSCSPSPIRVLRNTRPTRSPSTTEAASWFRPSASPHSLPGESWSRERRGPEREGEASCRSCWLACSIKSCFLMSSSASRLRILARWSKEGRTEIMYAYFEQTTGISTGHMLYSMQYRVWPVSRIKGVTQGKGKGEGNGCHLQSKPLPLSQILCTAYLWMTFLYHYQHWNYTSTILDILLIFSWGWLNFQSREATAVLQVTTAVNQILQLILWMWWTMHSYLSTHTTNQSYGHDSGTDFWEGL